MAPVAQSAIVRMLSLVASIENLTFASVLGLFIGAILLQKASWSWIFWFVALIATPAAVLSAILIPGNAHRTSNDKGRSSSIRDLDLGGVAILTVALILFIYAITTGSSTKWISAGVLTPMVIAILLIVGFFVYETRIPEENASLYVRLRIGSPALSNRNIVDHQRPGITRILPFSSLSLLCLTFGGQLFT